MWRVLFSIFFLQISCEEHLPLPRPPDSSPALPPSSATTVAASTDVLSVGEDLELYPHDEGTHWEWQEMVHRYLIGSNCLIIERGRAPPYEKCYGCEIHRAMNCLSDLRTNVTGNVPSGCRLHALNSEYDATCCPVYVQKKRKFFLRFETSGYPAALSCLRRVGCQATQVQSISVSPPLLIYPPLLPPPHTDLQQLVCGVCGGVQERYP